MNQLQRPQEQPRSMGARFGHPLIVVPVGDDEVRYFTSDEDADAYLAHERSTEPINLAGIWSDMDWKEADKALDRI